MSGVGVSSSLLRSSQPHFLF